MTVNADSLLAPRLYQSGFMGRVVAMLRLARRYPLATFGVVIVALTVLAAISAPVITNHSTTVGDLNAVLSGPSSSHWLGTDETGRDVYTRMVYGARATLEVGLLATALAALVGVPLGVIAAYSGGLADNIIVAILDVLLAFPALIFALGLIAVFGPGISNVIIAIGVIGMPAYARVARSEALSVSGRDFVLASRCSGASGTYLAFRHVLPNVLSPLIVLTSTGIAAAVLAEAGLDFLGVGVRPPTPTWGTILQDGFTYLTRTSWLSFFPGMAIFLFVLSINFIGDALRDALDPRLRGR